jgi:hypothetical protein
VPNVSDGPQKVKLFNPAALLPSCRPTVIGSQIAREKSIGVAVNGRYSIDLIGRRFGIE